MNQCQVHLLPTDDERFESRCYFKTRPECSLIQKSEQKIGNGAAQIWIRTTVFRLICPEDLHRLLSHWGLGSYPEPDNDPMFYH